MNTVHSHLLPPLDVDKCVHITPRVHKTTLKHTEAINYQQQVLPVPLNGMAATAMADPAATMDTEDDFPILKRPRRSPILENQPNITTRPPIDHTPAPNKASYLLRSTTGLKIFANPARVNQAIRQSPLHKFLLEGETRSLGNGSALIIAVWEHNIQNIPLLKQNPFQLGEWEVTCRRAEREDNNTVYAKVGPFSEDTSIQEIMDSLTVLEGGVVEEITWIPTRHLPRNTTGKWLRLKAKDQRPTKVAISGLVYRAHPYLLPLLRCPGCQRIGHTINTCTSQVRCSRCSGPHRYKQGEDTCTRPYHCFQCGGPHTPRSAYCQHNQEAQRLYKDQASTNTPLHAINKTLRELPTPRANPTQHTLPRPLFQTRPVQAGVSYAAITTTNRYAALQELGEEDGPPDLPPTTNDMPATRPNPPPTHNQNPRRHRRTHFASPNNNNTTRPQATIPPPQQQSEPQSLPTREDQDPLPPPNPPSQPDANTASLPPTPPITRPTTPFTPETSPQDLTTTTTKDEILNELLTALWDAFILHQQGTPLSVIGFKIWPTITKFLSYILK